MAETFAHTIPEEVHALHAHHPELSFFRKYIWSEDHKTIAKQYLFTTLFFCWLEVRLPWASAFSWPSRVLPFL